MADEFAHDRARIIRHACMVQKEHHPTTPPPHIMNPKRIEEVSLNSWRALQQMLYDGWILRFADGYTRRANSITLLYPSSLDISEKISTCEALVRVRGLPPLFRLTPFSYPSEIDQILERRGYKRMGDMFLFSRQLVPVGRVPLLVGHTRKRRESL